MKVVFNDFNHALYFSRAPIPFARTWEDSLLTAEPACYHQHIGLYAYRRDFLLSIMFSRLLFTFLEISVLLGFAWLVFGVTIRGNPLALLFLILLGGATFGGIGLLIACRAKTIETISGLVNAVMLPMYLFGGVFFPSDQFPQEIQPVLNLLPLTVLNQGLRAVINEGAGWDAVFIPGIILAAWGTISFVLALRWFRWQ